MEELEQKISILERKLALYENDAIYRGYYTLNSIVNQQINYLQGFKIKEEIGADPKESKAYDRAKGLWEGLKTMITDLDALKKELSIPTDGKEENKKVFFLDTLAEKRM